MVAVESKRGRGLWRVCGSQTTRPHDPVLLSRLDSELKTLFLNFHCCRSLPAGFSFSGNYSITPIMSQPGRKRKRKVESEVNDLLDSDDELQKNGFAFAGGPSGSKSASSRPTGVFSSSQQRISDGCLITEPIVISDDDSPAPPTLRNAPRPQAQRPVPDARRVSGSVPSKRRQPEQSHSDSPNKRTSSGGLAPASLSDPPVSIKQQDRSPSCSETLASSSYTCLFVAKPQDKQLSIAPSITPSSSSSSRTVFINPSPIQVDEPPEVNVSRFG